VLGTSGRPLLGASTPCWNARQQGMLDMDTGGMDSLHPSDLPECDQSGHYRPKQCTRSKCYCVNPDGTRVNGYERNTYDAQDMQCGCVRRKHELSQSGRLGETIVCNELGNFHSHQCRGSVCFCVDHLTGVKKPGAKEVPVSAVARLQQECAPLGANHPCWDERERATGSGLLGAHPPACDLYGQYAPKQCKGSRCTCVDPAGGALSSYAAHISETEQMHCHCARQEWEVRRDGLLGVSVRCDTRGNYETQQCVGSACHAVDPVTGAKTQEPLLGADRHCDQEVRRLAGSGGAQPQCDRSGRYAARQCKSGVCYCADPEGNRLADYRSRAEASATCHCARRQYEITRSRVRGLSVRCDAQGDYEPRQCMGSQCYCVDPGTGSRLRHVAAQHVAQLDQLDCGGAGGVRGEPLTRGY